MKKLLSISIILVLQVSLLLSQTPWQDFVNEQKAKADAGDIEAQGLVNICILSGVSEGDKSKAFEQSELISEKGSLYGQIALAYAYENGWGVEKNEVKAQEYYAKTLGRLQERSDSNDPIAMSVLAYRFYKGTGVTKNPNRAFMLNKSSAELGYIPAQYSIAYSYFTGEGVGKDETEAVKWCRKAAEQGFAVAQFGLGKSYAEGIGIGKDEAEAVRWYRKAAEQGSADAQFNLSVCYFRGSGVEIDKTKSFKFLRKAAEQGFALAQYNMGYCYLNGDNSVVKDEAEAIRWYRKAAEQGFALAQYNMGYCYETGKGVGKDKAEAVKWYLKAGEQGDLEAQKKLGYCYAQGEGVSTNQEEAAKWYLKAAEQGDYISQKNMAHRYFYGSGVKVSKASSEMWQQKASENLLQEISKASANFNPSSKGPKVKGLILGMPIPNAYDRIQAIFKEAFPDVEVVLASDKKDGDYIFSITVSNSVLGMTYPVIAFRGDVENGVKGFSFQSQLTEKAFNSADLNAFEFAKEFIDSYGIPELNVEKDIWVYKSDEGWQLDIDEKKNVVITLIASKSERKFD
jgi:TPR repeat protein